MNANSSGTTNTPLFRDGVYAVVGVAFEVHRELGPGFLLKAIDRLSGREDAQTLNYLKASAAPVGVLVNFGGHPKPDWRRLARTEQHSR